MPPLVIGAAFRLGLDDFVFGTPIALNTGFEWMSSTPALVIFSVALVVEVLADKIPAVDHGLDILQTIVRPLAGTLVVAASLDGVSPLAASVIGLITGGTVAGGVHLAKSQLRVLSTAGSGGLLTPILSVGEDVVAFFGAVLATLSVAFGVLFLISAGLLFWALLRRVRRPSSAPA